MEKYPEKKDDISIVLCGAAGQGVQTVEQLLTHLFKRSGYNLFATKEYMSRVRGGSNSTELRVSSWRVQAYLDRIDILFPLSREAMKHVEHRVTGETIILGEKEKLLSPDGSQDMAIIDIPLSDIASKIGGAIYANIIATGVIAALFDMDRQSIIDDLSRRFSKKGDTVLANNIRAIEHGYDIGHGLIRSGAVTITMKKHSDVADDIIISGGEAVGMGAIAGGCNFISSYPMTPSTAVLTFLAQQSKAFDIIAEQAEDEIAAMNMAIGAWYAGARGMVTTSGGGFALMTEGLSLAGMMESPMVIHLAQRPGPATGLPTRTEQGDLDLALYAGHGEFPRIIFAPGTLQQAFELTAKAFNLADKYQVPVFILTDQYFIDSYYNTPRIDVSGCEIERYIVATEKGYARYALTENGISPRGIPGDGKGLVVVDSDEHDEAGHLTEDHHVRISMVDKRLGKTALLQQEAVFPEVLGKSACKTMIVCWGSTFTIASEAIRRLGRDDICLAHFSQVYPLHPRTADILSKPDRLVIVENNATSQFARVLKIHADIDMKRKVVKYNGLAFSVEELENGLGELL
ncbi:MAG: 2-oxoacid:acceptor oxidoreductase subunit alpha [Deltaproteobacteria bacterium]|nr:2-oxoacid:acceptor oxidoreductase subunit alpha [Deltaproteobacteria bacterium]